MVNEDSKNRELLEAFKPKYYVVWTSRFSDETQSIVAAFAGEYGVAQFMEAQPERHRQDLHVIDAAGREDVEIAVLTGKEDPYSHAQRLMDIVMPDNEEAPHYARIREKAKTDKSWRLVDVKKRR